MDGISAYQENAVATQPRGKIVVMLYDGAVRFLKRSISEMGEGKCPEKGQSINKAVAIIEELNFNLDMKAGGEIAANLRQLYLFMLRRLHQAHFHNDPGAIRQVIGLLEELNAGWKAIAE